MLRGGTRQVTGIGGTRNCLLATLPPADFDLLAPSLETVALAQDEVISREGDRVDYILFPHSGAISLMVDFADGETAATAIVGREGAIGTLSVFGPAPCALTAIVRAGGIASRIPAPRFHAAFGRSPAIRQAIQVHVRAMLAQLQRGGACNARHPVQARMARWLLHIRDRIDDDVLPLTQEALSQILGVRRTTVTLLMRRLRAFGAIRSERRGHIEIDRLKLVAAACECHGTMRREVEAIFSMKAACPSAAVPSFGAGVND
ncbi:Crp/Fnr family transcriptional regulator [Bradyrhizobium sp. CCBAU 11357]|uniref:Crp/Fnr family transcriptional regulator n=1 Tax=Bradyrhizobium sp. CCBAU 11357 TaxID=1630808 RepID=UPI002303ED95|nr:Crp/Fnr family transcriptional regulator [Bradyrhizobium sp. CCBAU 11357]MDA9497650.1 cyclic nucleotide-binding protein [Bradyrhizobium sp. CCBAU 11357]